MKKKKVNYYGVYDGETLICEGLAQDIAAYFGLRKESIPSYYQRAGRIKDKYTIDVIKQVDKYYNTVSIPKNEKKVLDYLVRHLTAHGNTTMNDKPDKYIPMLEEKGIKIRIYKLADTNGEEIRKSKGKKKYHYLLERI